MTLAVALFQRGAVAPSLFEGREGLQQSTKTLSNKTCNNLTHSAHSIYGSALHDTHDVQQLPQQKTCNKPCNKLNCVRERNSDMPHPKSSVFLHPERLAIEAALDSGESVRSVAERFNLKPTSVHRYKNRERNAKARINTGEITRIDREISKLIRAQNRAKRKRNTTESLAIARELRSWFALRAKAEVMASAAQTEQEDSTLSRSEALALAQGLIESEVNAGGQEIIAWLRALVERATGTLPEGQ
jgi:leucyl aminopeptidase